MKVLFAIDAIKFPLTGIGNYTLNLAKQLARISEVEKLLLFNRFMIQTSLPVFPRTSFLTFEFLKKFFKKNNTLTEICRLALPLYQKCILRNYHNYIYHSPNYYLPIQMPRSLVTFHDISIFTYPEHHPPERVRYLRKAMLSSLRLASHVITVSYFSKNELMSYFNYPFKKIHVTPLACDTSFYPRVEDKVVPLLSKLGIRYRGYSLFIGTIEPRKNLMTLINAYKKLPQVLRKHYPLVISGYKGWNSMVEHRAFERGSLEGWISYLGYIKQEELPILFSAARLFIFPSLYEGFGLPVLEAMASGVPVICSNTSSLPEIANNKALTFNPHDVDALSTWIEKGLQDEKWRAEAIKTGLVRAKMFSWKRCAQDTVNAYLKV